MQFKSKHFFIPFVTLVVAILGASLTKGGMDWYQHELILPSITPPKWVFPLAWNLIFITATISALIIARSSNPYKKVILGVFGLNAILNVAWTYLFFVEHALQASFIEILVLEATNLFILISAWRLSKPAAVLMLPYLVWVGLASVLTYQVLLLNS